MAARSISTWAALWINRRERVLVQQRHVVRLEHAFQHEDRLGYARDPQACRFLEVEHRETVGRIERARRALEPVARTHLP